MSRNDKVVYLCRPKRYTLAAVKKLFPRVQAITEEAVTDVTPLMNEIHSIALEGKPDRVTPVLEERISEWAFEIRKLGAVPKGLWIVDFDCGRGYYCWRFGEREVSYFHGYGEGFHGRMPIVELSKRAPGKRNK